MQAGRSPAQPAQAAPGDPPGRRPPLAVYAILSLAGYLALAVWFPLRLHFDQAPPADIRTFTPSLAAGAAYGSLNLLLYAVYALAYRRLRQAGATARLGPILIGTALFSLPLLLTYPINANDIYRYYIRGRIAVVYGENPFTTAIASIDDDPYLPLAGEWGGETSPYGPIWEMAAAAVTAAAPESLFNGLVAFKLLGAVFFGLGGLLLWHLLDHLPPGDRSAYTLLWAWNPALLLIFVVDAHNDSMMLLWLLLGLLLMRSGRPTTGFLVMLLAPLTKAIGLLPLPFFFVAAWRQLPQARARARLALLSAGGGVALVWLAFLPFGPPLDSWQRLLREAAAGASFSTGALTVLLSRRLGAGIPLDWLAWAGVLWLGLVALWLLWRSWRGRSALKAAADIFLAYVLQALNFRIWYTAWPAPWLLLDGAEQRPGGPIPYRLRFGLWFLLSGQLSVLIYGHVRVYLLGGDQLAAHLLGVTFTFGLPLLLAFFPWPDRGRQTGEESSEEAQAL